MTRNWTSLCVEQWDTLVGTGVAESSAGGKDSSEGSETCNMAHAWSESMAAVSWILHSEGVQWKGSKQHCPFLQEGNLPRICPFPWRPKKLQSLHQLPHPQAEVQSSIIPLRSSEAQIQDNLILLCLSLWGGFFLFWGMCGFCITCVFLKSKINSNSISAAGLSLRLANCRETSINFHQNYLKIQPPEFFFSTSINKMVLISLVKFLESLWCLL